MKSVKETAATAAVQQVVKYVKKDPDKRLLQLLKIIEAADRRKVNQSTYDSLHRVLDDPNNNWTIFIKKLLCDVNPQVLEKMIPAGMNIAINSYDKRNATIDKYQCNVPWAILMDPTAACNLKCTGCWAAEYGKDCSMDYATLAKIVREGKAMGTYMFIFSGGEPLVRKHDLIRLCQENPECAFMAFTNGTLCDDQFADDLLKVGNFYLAFSIEGDEAATDMRRGKGTYQHVLKAMKRLRDRGVPFGASLCYHRQNTELVGSDDYIDWLIDQGVMFAWYFTYMPVGADAVPELLATAEQRKYMYEQIRRARKEKPIFTMDFWNDGEYVQGCIAGGRHYFHINANGDCEPCAFVHYSSVNIKEVSLIEALQSPLFKSYYKRQPFNRNMLRPCPVLDNPEKIKEIVEESGAHSTEMLNPEDVNDLIGKTKDVAEKWAAVSAELWSDDTLDKHNTPSVMYKEK
ncbi:MAG: radical SAM protein [Clostridiales bacterium]|nr:radical SAM protein [Clostridiales bacterium]